MNTAHTEGGGGVLIHQGEMILLHAPLTVLSFSGSDDLKKCSDISGTSYLTTHRLIFFAKTAKAELKSFSFPFCVLSEVDVEQPVFGANLLKGKVRAQPNGNWRGEAKFKIQFKSGGAIEFAQGMMSAIRLARQVMPENPCWSAPPPDYATAASMPAPASTYYAPPAAGYYGWMPPAYNFPPPEAGTVYIMEAPPPYPGLGFVQPGMNQNYPPGQGGNFGYGNQQGYAPPQANGFAYPTAPPPYQQYAPGDKKVN
jgi:hypothetical protein